MSAAPVRRAIDPITARPVVQQACDTCRTKKVRTIAAVTGQVLQANTLPSDQVHWREIGLSSLQSSFQRVCLHARAR